MSPQLCPFPASLQKALAHHQKTSCIILDKNIASLLGHTSLSLVLRDDPEDQIVIRLSDIALREMS